MGLLSKAAEGNPNNNGALRAGLLKIISQKHRTQNKRAVPVRAVEESSGGSSPLEKAVLENLNSCYAKFGIFQGVLIEALKYSAGEFTGRLSLMVSGFGAAQGLAPGRALVLFSSVQDGELIGSHLAKTVPGKNIFSFHANTPQEAFSLIKAYL